MHILPKSLALGGVLAALAMGSATASDATDLAREMKLPLPVVENVLKNVDLFFAANDGPANRIMSGTVKEITLKAIKDRFTSLEDSGPGKSSETSAGDRNASYHSVVRATRHETAESRECVDTRVTATASESLPVVKDGAFTLDAIHPKVSAYSWPMTFCRAPINGGTDFSEWQLSNAK